MSPTGVLPILVLLALGAPAAADDWDGRQRAYLKAAHTDPWDFFGGAVAVDGDTLVVGSAGEDSASAGLGGDPTDDGATESGAVTVFVRNGSGWTQQAWLKASNAEAEDAFGLAVDVSGDTLVVGAPLEDGGAAGVGGDETSNDLWSAGAVYVFVRSGGLWSQQAYIKASDPAAAAEFGWSVAIDGDTLVVGAPDDVVLSPGGTGKAYVFVREAGVWSQQMLLQAEHVGNGDLFGISVDIDGERIVVGAEREDGSTTGVNGDATDNGASSAGAAYVFGRRAGLWTQHAYLKASNTQGKDRFGRSVSISGSTVVVGAPLEDSEAVGVDGDPFDENFDSFNGGAAYVFEHVGPTAHDWVQQAYLKASNTDWGDDFGHAVALHGDTIVVGARREDGRSSGVDGDITSNGATDAGAAYVYTRAGGGWSVAAYLKPHNNERWDNFGNAVAVSGTTLVVGAEHEDGSGPGPSADPFDNGVNSAGAVHVYDETAAAAAVAHPLGDLRDRLAALLQSIVPDGWLAVSGTEPTQ